MCIRDRHYDVLIVGAGPAGCSAARAAAQTGASVALVERRSAVGLPVRCAEYIPAMLVGQADVGKGYIAQATLEMCIRDRCRIRPAVWDSASLCWVL